MDRRRFVLIGKLFALFGKSFCADWKVFCVAFLAVEL